MLDFEQFCQLASQGNFIPVYRRWVADLETPVSAWYRVCAQQPYSLLLESVEGGEHIARYSFLGCDPLWVLTVRGDSTTQTWRDGTIHTFTGDPFAILETCLQPYHPVTVPELPESIGGLFGYWGYEMIRWMEATVPIHPPQAGDPPDAILMQMDSLLIFDQVRRQIWVIAFADTRQGSLEDAYAQACDRIESLIRQLGSPLVSQPLPWSDQPHPVEVKAHTSPEAYQAAVKRAKAYITEGDIFQVVLSQRFSAAYRGDPFLLYRGLRFINPSPYMAFFRFGEFYVIGSSPEVMVKLSRQGSQALAMVRPIAGTRPRGQTAAEDQALAAELLQDPKELAEHVMLVDLGRNDLGRVCTLGSVKVEQLMQIERYSHVMHIVSQVVGQVQCRYSAWDVLKATFPAGTVTGAPKIRAMQIIWELEGCRRGPYSGAYGFYDFRGQLNTAITIRTLWIQGDQVIWQAGAGIVADSDPQREQEECLNKAKGLLTALAHLP